MHPKRKAACAAVLTALLLCACSPNSAANAEEIGPGYFPRHDTVAEARATDLAGYTFQLKSVEDYFHTDWIDSILVVEFLTPGEYEVCVDGELTSTARGDPLDLRTYGAVTEAKVLQVLKGDALLAGSTVSVAEAMYLCEDGTYISRYLSEPTMKRAVICAHYADEVDQYICATPEWQIILLNDDDTLAIWPFLENAAEYHTLAAFTAMAADELANN